MSTSAEGQGDEIQMDDQATIDRHHNEFIQVIRVVDALREEVHKVGNGDRIEGVSAEVAALALQMAPVVPAVQEIKVALKELPCTDQKVAIGILKEQMGQKKANWARVVTLGLGLVSAIGTTAIGYLLVRLLETLNGGG